MTIATGRHKLLNSEQRSAVLNAAARGESRLKIAKAFGVHPDTVTNIAGKAGIRFANPPLTSETKQMVVDLYRSGFGIVAIAAMVGSNTATVHQVVIAAGIRRSRQQAQDLKAAANPLQWGPLNPGRTWFLGLVYGDGGFHRSGNSMTLTIGNEDSNILPKVQTILDYKGTVSQREGCTQLSISARDFTRSIRVSYGLDENKCYNMRWPDIPPEFLSHFVRGLLDSDGSWHTRGGREKDLLVFNYSSASRTFVFALEECLSRCLDVCRRTVREQLRKTSTFKTRIVNRVPIYSLDYGHIDSCILGAWLYTGTTGAIRGERKFRIWTEGQRRVVLPWCFLRHLHSQQKLSAATQCCAPSNP